MVNACTMTQEFAFLDLWLLLQYAFCVMHETIEING
jgi:hypothetical protein